jgi:hypothetical protein
MIGAGRRRNFPQYYLPFAGDSLAMEGQGPMTRSSGAIGFVPAPVASSRLINAVAASLAFGAASLCLISTLKVLAIKLMAMPIPM